MVSKHIMERQGGCIEVESQLGRGAIFYIHTTDHWAVAT